jgi:hypothetical protein
MARNQIQYRWRLTFLVATFGLFFALLAALTGHPSWAVLLMLFGLLAPALVITFGWIALPEPLRWLRRRSMLLRFPMALCLLVLSFLIMHALGINPREYAYAPLLAPVIVTAFLLGFSPALVVVAFATAAADYYYTPPIYDLLIAEWEDILGLAVFASLGALVSLIIQEPS